MAVIIVRNYGADNEYIIGPFNSGEEASRYGFAHFSKEDWYWVPLNPPVE